MRQPPNHLLPEMTKSNRGPKPVYNREDTQGPLTKRGRITISLGDHGKIGIQKILRSDPSGLNQLKQDIGPHGP